MMPKRLHLTLALATLLMAATAYYAYLGGFKNVEVSNAQLPAQYLLGYPYKGFASDDAVLSFMRDIDLALKEGRIKGHLAVCYFGNPDQDRDSVQIFVGAINADSVAEVPAGLSQIRLEAGNTVQARIQSLSIVAPTPEEVNERLRNFANGQSLTTGHIHLERYLSPEFMLNDIYIASEK